MMKVDRSLKEVWEWKEKNYLEMKEMPSAERIIFLRKKAEEFKKAHHLKLNPAPQTEFLTNKRGQRPILRPFPI